MTAMTSDQRLVKQIQRRIRGWKPDEKCNSHSSVQNCVFDGQGRVILLHLCGLELVQIPLEVWQCIFLQELWLDNNRLSSLPAKLSQLTSLRVLRLGNNLLYSLPAELGQLTSLQDLSFYNNQLTSWPTGLGQLTSLQQLWLEHNQLDSLPAELGQLTSLQQLWLNDNLLYSLPVELGQLTSLQQLWLEHNQLDSLPVELGQLTSLRELRLEHNQLNSLPVELGRLTSLRELRLYGNPLQSLPSKIVAQGAPAILAYLRAQLPTASPAATRARPSAQGHPQPAIVAPDASPPRPITLFYCYAHEDQDLRDRIDKHLGILKRLGQVTGWYDREIQAGTEWEREIEDHLSTASIILLLVSADFVNSDYCYGVEMQKALEMHEKGKACVLPILLRPVDWQDAPFAKLQLLPTGAKPITSWLDQEEALEDVAKHIRAVVNTLRTHKS